MAIPLVLVRSRISIRVSRALLSPSGSFRYYSDNAKPDPLPTTSNNPTPVKKSEYIPQASYNRVSYEYPAPPEEPKFKPVESSPIKRHIPLLAGLAGLLWAVYAYRHFMSDEKSGDQNSLSPDRFATYKLTYKEDISSDIALLELSPKYDTHRELIKKKGGLWNGKKIWSVEVKQPEIQVVRKYTPLPMYYMQYKDDDETKGLLRLLGKDEDEGRFVLLVKRYSDGEVSRYLHKLPVGSDVEIRGPYFDYRFPYSPIDATEPRNPMLDLPSRMAPEYDHPEGVPLPENVAFFAGGTGITAVLQTLFSTNPPRGQTTVYYSVRSRNEIPFKRFLLFLEKAGRAKFHYFVDNENRFLGSNDIPDPVAVHYNSSQLNAEVKEQIEQEVKIQKMMEEMRRERELGIEVKPVNDSTSEPTSTSEAATTTESPSPSPAPAPAPSPSPSLPRINPKLKYNSILEQVADTSEPEEGPSLAVVCGPEGYINYVAGPMGAKNDEPIKGLLGEKGWDATNTFRMEP